ncbi:MAG: hypothetical protein ABIS35_09015 [Terracoccus sp.]
MSAIGIITPTHRQPAARGMWRGVAKVAAASILALAAVFAAPAAPADAATYVGAAGRIGSVTLNGPMLNAYDVGQRALGYSTFYSKNINVGGFTVTRSPSSYSQRVVGASYIQRWVGGQWVIVQSRTWPGIVSGTGTLRFPAWTWSPTLVQNQRWLYRVVFIVKWSDSFSGSTLGYTYVLPNVVADQRCSTVSLPCARYTYGVNF